MLSVEHRADYAFPHADGRDARRAAVAALRNRRLGLWAACMMEMNPFAADAYADEIVALGLQRGGEPAIIDRIIADFRRRGVDMAPEVLCIEAAHFTPRLEDITAGPGLQRIAA